GARERGRAGAPPSGAAARRPRGGGGPRLLPDGREEGQPRRLEAPPMLPPYEIEGARHVAVEDQRQEERRLMWDAAEGRGREQCVRRHVVAPQDATVHEDVAEAGQLRAREGGGGESFHRVARHHVSGDGAELARVSVEEM